MRARIISRLQLWRELLRPAAEQLRSMRARIISRLQHQIQLGIYLFLGSLNEGQDYIPATTWTTATSSERSPSLNEGQDYIPATTRRPQRADNPRPALNEGQDYIPATTC